MLRLRSDDLVTLGYIFSLGLVIVIFHNRLERWPLYLVLHIAAILLVLILVRMASSRGRRWVFIRNWYQVAFIPLAFKELNTLIPSIRKVDIDPVLVQIDRFLLGADPWAWLQQWSSPLLTEYLQLAYSSFYFLPIVLGGILWKKGKYHAFQKTLLAVVTAFYLSYIGYILFPALGPRYEIEYLRSMPLEGLFLTSWLRDTLDTLEGIQRDAFPSGHTGIALLVLYYAWLEERRSSPIFAIVVGSMIVSTVYLRYHYIVDVLAGVLLAFVSLGLAGWLDRWWKKRKGDDFIPW